MDETKTPLPVRIERARNAIRYAITQVSVTYDLPDYIVDNLCEAVLNEEKQRRLSQMAEAMTFDNDETENEGGGEENVECE